MGSVASFVGDVVGGAVDIVGDVVEGVGDVGQDIIDVAADTVETVGDTVGNVVQGALDDPIGTAAMIGTAIYAPQLLPVVSAGNVIANGGDIEDALISAGAVYAGQAVASTLNSQLGTALDYVTDVGSSQTSMLAAQDAGLDVRGREGRQAVADRAGGDRAGLPRRGRVGDLVPLPLTT
jgi:hypothetical protein